jgi:hypothetical protein
MWFKPQLAPDLCERDPVVSLIAIVSLIYQMSLGQQTLNYFAYLGDGVILLIRAHIEDSALNAG